MVYDPVEDGLGPGGRPAKLFQHHGRHASVQGLQIVSFSLSICPAFGHLFSEKLFGHIEIQVDSVDLHIQPELGALRLNDVNVSSVDGSYTARGRLSILLYLVGDKHGLLSGGCQACLPGKFGYEVSDAVMPAGVESFGATCGMPPVGIENVGASLAPRGGAATLLPRARGRESQPLVQPESENRVKESGLPLAGQAMEPLTVPMVAFRPGRCITWKVTDPLASQCVT